jgi:2-dehydro-3-deoxyglucarate aldolase
MAVDDNGVRELLDAGEAAMGAETVLGAPQLVELYGRIGLDFAWVDYEHQCRSPYDTTRLENQVRAAEAGGTSLIVRLPTGEPALVRKALDAGVRTVVVPRVETAEEVCRVVRAGRFSVAGTRGDRGLGNGRVNGWGTATEGYPAREDDSVSIGVMIETAAAVENVEAILSTPELGFVFLGAWDLSHALGQPMDTGHPVVREAIERVRSAARRADVPLGGFFPDHDAVGAALEEGYQLLLVGNEMLVVEEAFSDVLRAVDDGSSR